MSQESTSEPGGAVVTVDFVRGRNVLLTRADLSPLFVDYYLHLAEHGIKQAPEHDRLLKESLAAFALHCAARPRHEHLAWTINFQEPLVNLFLVGDNDDCTIAGRVFTENVRVAEHNVFYSDIAAGRVGAVPRRSIVNFEGTDAFRVAEVFYATSEQRIARYFDLGEDNFAMLTAHPDCDEKWLRAVDLTGVRALAATEHLTPIERRSYVWRCGCNQQKILGTLAAAAREDMAAVFGSDESIRVTCPRCAASYVITREAMEAFLAPRAPGPA